MGRYRTMLRLSATAGTIVLANVPEVASAQAASSREAQADPQPDIVVTAQRRAENVQTIPVAATALSSQALRDKAVTRIDDLQYAAPALSMTNNGLVESANIRGIGQADGSPQVVNGVAMYIDGIFHAPILTSGAFYDIADVEVFRGPQGTLVGSNSTGGAIFINTQAPKLDAVGGYLTAGYGSYDDVGTQGAINIPLTSTLAIRAAGNFERRDSFYHDRGAAHNEADRLNEKAGRLSVLWQPGMFKATLRAEWFDRDAGGWAWRPIPGTAYDIGRVGSIRDLSLDTPEQVIERGFYASAELRYQFKGGVVLRSLSGYTNKRVYDVWDTDATSGPLSNTSLPLGQFVDFATSEKAYSQEVNLISPADRPLDWIIGGYYRYSTIPVAIVQNTGSPVELVISPFNRKYQTGSFAQLGYKVTSAVAVQLGLRYSSYSVHQTGSVAVGAGLPGFPPGGIVVADLSSKERDQRLTGKANINWQIDSSNFVYAFVARGYKPGGANSATSRFAPETVWDYEGGWKSSFAGHHVQTQLSAFFMDYRGFQFSFLDRTTGQSGVNNVSNARIYGLEGQVQVHAGGFAADGGFAYVHSKLGRIVAVNSALLPPGASGPQCAPAAPSNPPSCFDYGPYLTEEGNGPNLFSPTWTVNFGGQYSIAAGAGTLTPRVNYAYVGPQYTSISYSPLTNRLNGHSLLSALITYRVRAFSIEVYGKNLLNAEYVTGQNYNNEFYGPPRQFGMRGTWTF